MLEVDQTTFEEEVLKAEGPVVVDFYSDDCGPCQALTPRIHALAEAYGGKLKFIAVNTTKSRRMMISQKIMGLPVVAVFQNGQKLEQLVKDDCTPEAVEAMIRKYI